MSDSDDDAAFESADEGENSPKTAGAAAASSGKTQKKAEEEVKEEEQVKKEPEKTKNAGKGKNKKKKKGKSASSSKTSIVDEAENRIAKSEEEKPKVEAEKTQKIDKPSADEKTTSKKENESKQTDIVSGDDSKVESVKIKSEKTDTPFKKDENTDKSVKKEENTDTKSPEKKEHLQSADAVKAREKTPQKTSGNLDVTDKNVITKSPQAETIPRSVDREHTPEQEQVLENESQSSGGWGWGWGSSILKTATSSVSTFTNQVGDGFTTLMDTVETTLGAPSPEVMAQNAKQEEPQQTSEKMPDKTEVSEDDAKIDRGATTEAGEIIEGENINKKEETKEAAAGGGGGWFTNISSLVQNTMSEGMGVLETIGSGSLDVMEKLGKKTYSVITEHDPGFRKARQFLGQKSDKPSLSEVLREAKVDADKRMEMEKESEEARESHFGCLFDEYQGLAHLEALEILSNQSEKKVQALLHAMSDEDITTIKPELMKIKDIFEIEENDDEETEHDFVTLVTEQLLELHLGTTPDKLNKVQEKARKWIIDFNSDKDEDQTVSNNPKEIHKVAIQSLANITSKSVEQFHKAGELVLLQKDTEKSYKERSTSLASLTQVLCNEIVILSTNFSQCLNKVGELEGNSKVVNPLVTNIYLEASNSSTYIQDAFQLLLPVLQHAVIQNSQVFQ